MKLNIGCGKDIKTGYLNIDCNYSPGVNLLCDVTSLPFTENSVDEIYASDIIEHFPWATTRSVLKEWRRVLKDTGTLWIRTPSLEGVIDLYSRRPTGWRRVDGEIKGVDPIVERLYGGQDFHGNFHYVIFDRTSISMVLENTGYFVGSINADGDDISNMCIRAYKKLKGKETYIHNSKCSKENRCSILKRFMQGIDTRELICEEKIRICSDDHRFYGLEVLTATTTSACPRLRALKKSYGNLLISWQAPTFGPSGYAFAARGYMLGLADMGARVHTKPIWGDCKLEFTDNDNSGGKDG